MRNKKVCKKKTVNHEDQHAMLNTLYGLKEIQKFQEIEDELKSIWNKKENKFCFEAFVMNKEKEHSERKLVTTNSWCLECARF